MLKNLNLNFKPFVSEDEIEMGRDILCLVSSWDEPPYFIIMTRKVFGIVVALDASPLVHTKILNWAYIPRIEWDSKKFDYVVKV